MTATYSRVSALPESTLAAKRRYNSSPKGRAARARYLQTAKGRETMRRAKAKSNLKHAEAIKLASRRRKVAQKADIDAIKLARGCVDCGYVSNPAALEFDHIGNDKIANVSRLIGSTWDRILAEIEKCEVVCANCHRIRTITRAQA